MGVSRETSGAGRLALPPPPPEAVEYFGPELDRVTAYGELLAGAGLERGLIGPREVPRLWDRHLLNSAVLRELIPDDATVCDVGSGAGLPGIVMALLRPDLRVTLLEPQLRRTAFLTECVSRLRLGNVDVVRGRAEELHGRLEVDIATARAVAPLGRLVRWSVPLLRPGGQLLALKGGRAHAELDAAHADLAQMAVAEWSVVEVGQGVVDPPATVIRIRVDRAARRRSRVRS